MSELQIHQIPALSDNFIYLIHDPSLKVTACVDPAEAEPVLDFLSKSHLKLDFILNTHHHWDHVGGNLALKAQTHCQIVGNKLDAERIPGIDIELGEGDHFSVGNHTATILRLDGHTLGHIAYWFADDCALFSGDTLFSIGCGRLFEGTAEQMWHSLKTLRALPDETLVYCTHEYTQSNLKFALQIEPNNAALIAKSKSVNQLRREGNYSVPMLLGEEKLLNPFLRADETQLKNHLGLSGSSDEAVFASLRKQKDNF